MPKFNLAAFCYLIHCLCNLYPASVTSWIRTPTRNRAVGGHPKSKHLVGAAVDVALDDPQQKPAFVRACKALGLQAIDEGDHIHVEYDDAPV